MAQKQCKIRIIDEVTAFIVGLQTEDMKTLYDQYGVPSAGHFFHPLFKLGQWDGKIRYFHSNGKTFVYLLDEIIPKLRRMNYKLQLEDLRTGVPVDVPYITDQMYAHVGHSDTGEPTVLRDYQVNGVNALIEHGYGILLASTGAGKTIICTSLVDAYGQQGIKTLTIVPNQDLIKQTKRDYIHYGLDVGEYSGTHKDIEHQHVISTWQALKNNPTIVRNFQLVLVDECHGARGNALQKILIDHSANIMYRFGVTGTLPKDQAERLSVTLALGPVRQTVTAKSLIDIGVLAKPSIDVMILEEDLREEYQKFCDEDMPGSKPPTYAQFKDGYFGDYSAEKSFIHRKQSRSEWIAETILARRDLTGNTLVLVDSVSFARKLAAMIPNAIVVNGQDVKKNEDREKVYALFKDHDDLVVIATVHIAGTGLSIRRIFNMVTIDIGQSFIRVIQAIGRGLRTASDKDSVHITDICSDMKYGKKHLKERINYYKEAEYPFKKSKVDYVKQLEILDGKG